MRRTSIPAELAVADRCVQVLGGIGISDETVVEMIFRDMRAFRRYDGPTEVPKYARPPRVAGLSQVHGAAGTANSTRLPSSGMSSELLVDVSAGIAVLTLNRPAQQNAVTPAMAAELSAALQRCDVEDAIRAVIITGTAPSFCAGADLSNRVGDVSATIEPAPWRVRKPVIAAVNGHAVGIGLALALQCDLRYMARDAVYGLNQVRRGVVADGYAHWTLPRLVGTANAADIMLTGRTFDGDEAKAMGLANGCLPAGEVLPTALAIAHDIATGAAPLPVALSKRLLWESLGMSPAMVGQLETDLNEHVGKSVDGGEAMAAFRERRQPNWTGSISEEWPTWDSTGDKQRPSLD